MKERPILFSGPMVRAILDGRKTVTRRLMRTNHVGYRAFYRWDGEPFRRAMMRCLNETEPGSSVFCEDNRFGVPGDRLWVRETWGLHAYGDQTDWHTAGVRGATDAILAHWQLAYQADWGPMREGTRWRPSIYMPRWASRITLEIVDVRVERLHEIDEQDARAEGLDWAAPHFLDKNLDHDDREDPREVGYAIVGEYCGFARDNFARLWEHLHGAGSWAANPWVWRVEFRRLSDRGAA